MFLAEKILILMFVLISDLRGFLLLAIKVGVLNVHLLSWVSVIFSFFFWGGGGSFIIFLLILFSVSVDGIGCSEVSGWPSGSQWVAYADSFSIICFSQWVACT